MLISLDGTRPADLTSTRLPSLLALAGKGAMAERLVPVDPANTFPSHVSLATGVRPEVHRLVNNSFIDPETGRFDRSVPHRYIEAEPIWSIAERHGLPTASFYWVGSEGPWQGGPGPRDTRRFSSRTSERKKVDQILEWLAIEDEAERPRLILTWFHGADHAAHVDGPGAPSVAESLRPQDRAIARLVQEMRAKGQFEWATLIFVSDHGMASAGERIDLGKLLRRAGLDVRVIGTGGFSMVYFDEGAKSEGSVERAVVLCREAGLEAWPREAAPGSWHVGDVRFGDIVVRAPIGTAIVTPTTRIDGFHGYRAEQPEMGGILVARGRGVRPGARLGVISSLSVAPTVLRLLGLPIPERMEAAPISALLEGIAGHAGARTERVDTPER